MATLNRLGLNKNSVPGWLQRSMCAGLQDKEAVLGGRVCLQSAIVNGIEDELAEFWCSRRV
jgi:hypothetical protein